MKQRPIILEIACGDLRDALAAESARADRIELCSALDLEGLTPSLGTAVEVFRRISVPFVGMVRPRAGDFVYSSGELSVMLRDAQLLMDAGASGIVVGCLTNSGTIDARACEQFVALAGESETVFHRAFDRVKDQMVALQTLMDLGFTRILTSGGAPTALSGARRIRQFVERAAGRIEILPAGGIRENNVEAVVLQTGCEQVHLSRR
jgi:copper homeostasis protein